MAGGWYDGLSPDELRVRLEAAEALCLMYGWSPADHSHPRGKAAHELWERWLDLVGMPFTDPQKHPELNDEVVAALAAQRDATRAETLARLRGIVP